MDFREQEYLDYQRELEEEFECTECANTVEIEGTQCCGKCFESSMR